MRIVVSRRAAADVDRLEAWLLERGAPSAALRVGELLFDAIDSLQQMPERGRMSSRPGSRELVVPFGAAAYVFLYKITADAVIIARIQHGRERR